MSTPKNLKYTESHEWIRVDGDEITVGISWFAQDSLGDVVHVELPEVGDEAITGEGCCEIESVKAVSDIYSPVNGEITAVNEELDGNEELVNADPYEEGWLFRVKYDDIAEVEALMDADAYEKHIAEE